MALNLPARIPAALARFARASAADRDDDDERTAQLAEQIGTALAVMLAVGVVLSIAMLLGMT
ncbi:MAG: hypothetical protein AB7O50_14275 [Pseudolabrys sp.]